MPDIDVDFCFERRQEVIDYVVRKYGKDRVVQIVTFGTMAARGVLRDVGRGHGSSLQFCGFHRQAGAPGAEYHPGEGPEDEPGAAQEI